MKGIVDNQLSVSTVISDRAIKSSEEAQKILQVLAKAAVQHNYREIVHELTDLERDGSSLPDPYSDVPEVRPVTFSMKRVRTEGITLWATTLPDGELTVGDAPVDLP